MRWIKHALRDSVSEKGAKVVPSTMTGASATMAPPTVLKKHSWLGPPQTASRVTTAPLWGRRSMVPAAITAARCIGAGSIPVRDGHLHNHLGPLTMIERSLPSCMAHWSGADLSRIFDSAT